MKDGEYQSPTCVHQVSAMSRMVNYTTIILSDAEVTSTFCWFVFVNWSIRLVLRACRVVSSICPLSWPTLFSNNGKIVPLTLLSLLLNCRSCSSLRSRQGLVVAGPPWTVGDETDSAVGDVEAVAEASRAGENGEAVETSTVTECWRRIRGSLQMGSHKTSGLPLSSGSSLLRPRVVLELCEQWFDH